MQLSYQNNRVELNKNTYIYTSEKEIRRPALTMTKLRCAREPFLVQSSRGNFCMGCLNKTTQWNSVQDFHQLIKF